MPNKTIRLVIILATVCAALLAFAVAGKLACLQATSEVHSEIQNKTALWVEAFSDVVGRARQAFEKIEAQKVEISPEAMSQALRRMVQETPFYRQAWYVSGNAVVCSDTEVKTSDVPTGAAFDVGGKIGDLRLVYVPETSGKNACLMLNYRASAARSYHVSIPASGLSDVMRLVERDPVHAIYVLTSDGQVVDHSLDAFTIASPPKGLPNLGFSESEERIIFASEIPSNHGIVVGITSPKIIGAKCLNIFPLYFGVASLVVFCILVLAWVAIVRTKSLHSELREAARENQIVAHYQPVMDLQTMRCVGFEVLMRWQHPVRGLMPPMEFIPEAERTGLITELTGCLMRVAMEELAPVFQENPNLHAAINIPVQTLLNPAFPLEVDRIVSRRFSYKQILFELTESTSLNDAGIAELQAMKDLGIRLAVDDFGTGYSNLRYLSLFPFDFLKIDKAFVDGISTEGKSSGLVDQIVSIGRSCGLKLVAEGVEHQAQADYLKKLGIEFGQGYLFAAPMPIGRLKEWLALQAVASSSGAPGAL